MQNKMPKYEKKASICGITPFVIMTVRHSVQSNVEALNPINNWSRKLPNLRPPIGTRSFSIEASPLTTTTATAVRRCFQRYTVAILYTKLSCRLGFKHSTPPLPTSNESDRFLRRYVPGVDWKESFRGGRYSSTTTFARPHFWISVIHFTLPVHSLR